MAQARAKRARRWSRRAQLRKITSIGRVRRCGYCNPEAGPTLAVTENGDGTRTAGYGGLATCGSVWVCPQCAAKIVPGRADELSQVMRAVDAAGGSAFMLTLTMLHSAGDRLGLSMADRERLSLLEKRRKSRTAGRLSKKDADLAELRKEKRRLEVENEIDPSPGSAGTNGPSPGAGRDGPSAIGRGRRLKMSSSIQQSLRAANRPRALQRRQWSLQAALLSCGIAASLLYGAMIWVIRYAGYDPFSQTVSELSAWDVSTRTLWVWLGLLWSALMAAFATGVWRSGSRRRSLRVAGGLLGAYVLAGLAYPFASMHTRNVLAAGGATAADTAHLVIVSVTSVLMLAAMVSAAVAFGLWFRFYTTATILLLIVFGLLTSREASAVQANLPTPWAGLWERANIMATLGWVVVLAVLLIRQATHRDRSSAAGRA